MPSSQFIHGYLGYLLGQANHALFKDFDSHVRAAGLSSIEWRVLATLHDGEALTVSELARETLAKQPTVTKLVARMAAQGWLDLRNDATDQRRTLVAASAQGVALALPLVQEAKRHEAQLLQALDPPEKTALRKLLKKLAGETGPIPATPRVRLRRPAGVAPSKGGGAATRSARSLGVG